MNIPNLFSSIALTGAMLFCASTAAAEEPIITFHTNVYDNVGETNAFHFYLGAKQPTYVDVDCGFGPIEVEVGVANFDPEAGGIAGTVVAGTVSAEGIVKIYGDASLIDFIDMEGCYISDISFPTLTEVEILNLSYNELKALDLSHMSKLQALYVNNNTYSAESPLLIGPGKPDLAILEMSIIDHLDPSFNLSDYPALKSFEAWHVPDLTSLDPTGCPGLLRISVDVTNISSIDVSQNPDLLILNVSETKVTELDLSHNPYLTELYCGHLAAGYQDYKMTTLDVSHNPELQRLSCPGNALTTLDISNNPKLINFNAGHNLLTEISLDACPNLATVDLAMNYFTFATLPLPRETFNEYYYYQHPIALSRSYAIGSVIDLGDKVLRDGSTTQAFIFKTSEQDPAVEEMLDDEYYTYEDGKITLLKTVPDSVKVTFINDIFADYPLSTSKFLVKLAGDMDKPNPVVEMSFYPTVKNISFSIGMQGATEESPATFLVDFGDGNLTEFTATTSELPAEPNVNGTRTGRVTVYMPEGSDISAFAIDGQRLMSVDLSRAITLGRLAITDCQLPAIDLTWNRCLKSLDLAGNNLSSLDLSEPNGNYGKNVLSHIAAPRNRLSTVVLNTRATVVNLDLSDNQLATFDLTKLNNMTAVNLSGNQLTEVDLRDVEALVSLDLSDNRLTEITIPDYIPLTLLNISGNQFSLTTLPLPGSVAGYVYAPQKPVVLPTKAPSINLADNYLDVDGQVTGYRWVMDATGEAVPNGSIVATGNGRFRFADPDLGLVRCDMTHPLFPDFEDENILTTTAVQTAGMPGHVFTTFTTAEDGEASIIMAALADNTTVYIDWEGNGDLDQYVLRTTYIPFEATTHAGVTVKCYSYEEDELLTVFSLNEARLSSIDASPMRHLINFSVNGAGLKPENITFPACSATLTELSLQGNEISEIDLSEFKAVRVLNLNSNKFTTFDATGLTTLRGLYMANNQLTEVKLDNPMMWECALINNNIETIDLSHIPSMEQLYLSGNVLTGIDISAMPALKTLYVDHNKLTFATLPRGENLVTYLYSNQTPLTVEPADGYIVDLASQETCYGVPTTYTWYIDSPYYDENGDLVGENLYEGEEYTIAGGVTTFLKPFTHIMCVMTNTVLPNLVLYTDFIDVNPGDSGIEQTAAAVDLPARWYNLNGNCVAFTEAGRLPSLAAGIYIRVTTAGATKVLVK